MTDPRIELVAAAAVLCRLEDFAPPDRDVILDGVERWLARIEHPDPKQPKPMPALRLAA